MYKEKKDWTEHYKDWKRILPTIDGKKETDLFRRKIIELLIKDYEVNDTG